MKVRAVNFRAVFMWFKVMGALNAICVYDMGDGSLDISSYTIFGPNIARHDLVTYQVDETASLDSLFPDKLVDLKGYTFRTRVRNQDIRVMTAGKRSVGTGMIWFSIIAKKLNARLRVEVEDSADGDEKAYEKNFYIPLFNGDYDFLINSIIFFADKDGEKQLHPFKLINMYESDGMCVLLPFPNRESDLKFLLEPFETLVWLFIFLSMIAGAVAWKIANRDENSFGEYTFSFVSGIIGQGVALSGYNFRTKLILMMTVLVTFVMSTLYQSQVISSMLSPRYGKELTTFDEVLAENFTFIVEENFLIMLNATDQYPELKKRIVGELESYGAIDFDQSARKKIAFIRHCAQFKVLISIYRNSSVSNQKMSEKYYLVSEKLFSFYHHFPMAPFTPFYEKFQDMNQRMFEAGIKNHLIVSWKQDDSFSAMKLKLENKENECLKMKDLLPAFCVLGGGCVVSALAFIIELLFHRYGGGLVSRIRHLRPKHENESLNVRFIQVQPASSRVAWN